jgi:c(7)-type cytochrome triheme protein
MARRVVLVSIAAAIVVILAWSTAVSQTFGVRKRRPKPNEYGSVVIDNASTENEIAPVVFPHWIHRMKYTCRLCHVDIGFSMVANETGITEEDNRNEMYCGTCHNGEIAFGWQEEEKPGEAPRSCERCHSEGVDIKPKNDFYVFRKLMPRERFGNGIDWERAEKEELISPTDLLEGVSFSRPKLTNPRDQQLDASEVNMPDIVFSHQKHSVWNGCEVCHPQVFSIEKGATPYTMQDIFDGRFCGACHSKVAFPSDDCQRCHTEPVM